MNQELVQGRAKKWATGWEEVFKQVEAEGVSNSMDKIHQTWGPLFNLSLYSTVVENET